MNVYSIFTVWGTAILAAVLLPGLILEGKDTAIRRIGIPGGAAGLVVRYMLAEKMTADTVRLIHYEPYSLYDCCAAASQYALGSGRLDMAIMCPDAAEALVAKDNRYTIAGPVMINSDIFITHASLMPPDVAIAVSRQRTFQDRMVIKRYGPNARPVPMLHAGIPFAYGREEVQGAVLDIIDSFKLTGFRRAANVNGEDVVTYVLAVKKSLKNTASYRHFMHLYGKAVEKANDPDMLLRLLQRFGSSDYTAGEVEIWKKLDVRFLHPSGSMTVK